MGNCIGKQGEKKEIEPIAIDPPPNDVPLTTVQESEDENSFKKPFCRIPTEFGRNHQDSTAISRNPFDSGPNHKRTDAVCSTLEIPVVGTDGGPPVSNRRISPKKREPALSGGTDPSNSKSINPETNVPITADTIRQNAIPMDHSNKPRYQLLHCYRIAPNNQKRILVIARDPPPNLYTNDFSAAEQQLAQELLQSVNSLDCDIYLSAQKPLKSISARLNYMTSKKRFSHQRKRSRSLLDVNVKSMQEDIHPLLQKCKQEPCLSPPPVMGKLLPAPVLVNGEYDSLIIQPPFTNPISLLNDNVNITVNPLASPSPTTVSSNEFQSMSSSELVNSPSTTHTSHDSGQTRFSHAADLLRQSQSVTSITSA